MRTLLLMLMVGASGLMAGCGKKPKEVAKNNNTGGGGGDDGFMVVDGGRAASGGGGGGNGGQPAPQPAPAPSGGGNTNYQPGFGAAQAVRKAGLRTISLNEMKGLGLTVTQLADDLAKMPTAAEIKQGVQQDKTLSGMIADGSIILTNTTNRGGLWAYEVDADKKGGIVLVAGTASRASADDVKQYLANK